MDPEANRRQQLAICKEMRKFTEGKFDARCYNERDVDKKLAELGTELGELVEAAYAWRQMGGFDPFWKVTS
jgi:hypothetical protein